MLISAAYAQEAGSAGGGDFFVQIMPLLLIFVVFYFLLIRPQQKKMKAHRDMVGGLQRGDKVITGGGLFATVSKVEEDVLVLEIADGVRVKAARNTITEVNAKPVPRNDNDSKESASDGKNN
ncbi:MAG: preprotein translocase subunit YajC [Rhodospirillaceae bacterium]|nr:preprotein translocase subunit YajC [Rhodospirillaceae bacterium]|tara:strand:- start:443 stop:808 length:366 start_codon:yes stop_codon:yes gene_type:complete